MELKSMRLTKAEREHEAPEAASPSEREYPYSLCLSLDEELLKKLEVYGLPRVGETMMLMAQVKVESVSQREEEDGKERSITIQITDAALARDGKHDRADLVYGQGDG